MTTVLYLSCGSPSKEWVPFPQAIMGTKDVVDQDDWIMRSRVILGNVRVSHPFIRFLCAHIINSTLISHASSQRASLQDWQQENLASLRVSFSRQSTQQQHKPITTLVGHDLVMSSAEERPFDGNLSQNHFLHVLATTIKTMFRHMP